MIYLRREALKIRQDMDKLDDMVRRSEGWKDCAETTDREIRQIRALIYEAALAWDALLLHFDGTVYTGLTEDQKAIPIIPWSA